VKRSTLFGTNEAKVIASGARISYQGQTEANDEAGSYRLETFDVNVPVKKGQQLALKGNLTSMVRCSSGGDNTLIYAPPLGGAFRPATDTDGCWILMEARPPLAIKRRDRKNPGCIRVFAVSRYLSTWEPPTIASSPESPKTIQALLPPS
jgi:hypothetical protein